MAKVIGSLKVEDAQFTNDKNEVVKFQKYFIELNGEEIQFYPKADSKKLLNFLLKDNK